jgi:hypothetical protein
VKRAVENAQPFAYTRKTSTSGFSFPLQTFSKLGVGRPSPKSLIEAFDSIGVIIAVINGADRRRGTLSAEFGFMADFELENARRLFPAEKAERLAVVSELTRPIPNSVLVASPTLLPLYSRARQAESGWYRFLSLISRFWLPDYVDPPSGNEVMIKRFKKELDDMLETAKKEKERGPFIGYREATKDDFGALKRIYDETRSANIQLFVIAVLLVFAGTVGMLWFRGRHEATMRLHGRKD